jgi:hypothetical protein
MKTHYVYRITNKKENKHYYGVRSTISSPYDDLGVKYFSSSTDHDFMESQKNEKENYKYKIVRIFSTREDAIALEINLHEKFDVARNPNFYNKARQTNSSFDLEGTKRSDEFKKNLSELNKYKLKNGLMTLPTTKGQKLTQETLNKRAEWRKTLSQEEKDRISGKGKTISENQKEFLRSISQGKDNNNVKIWKIIDSLGNEYIVDYGLTNFAKEKELNQGSLYNLNEVPKLSGPLKGWTKIQLG